MTVAVAHWQNEETQETVGEIARCMTRSMENDTNPLALNY